MYGLMFMRRCARAAHEPTHTRTLIFSPTQCSQWMLIAAVVDLFIRRPPTAEGEAAVAPPPTARTYEPVFVQGTLCERVLDEDTGHSFYVCQTEVDDDEYSCRCAAKDGKWVWYCTEPS